MKEDSEFEYQTCAIEETDIPEECPGIYLNGQSLEIVEKLCYRSHEIRAKARAVTSAIRKAKSGWSKFRDLVPLGVIRQIIFNIWDKVFKSGPNKICGRSQNF